MPIVPVCDKSHIYLIFSGARACQGETVQLQSRRGPIDGGFSHGWLVSRAFQSILAAAGLLMMVAGHEVAAEEAGTAPTCTGCDTPAPSPPHIVKPSVPSKPSRPSAAAVPTVNDDGSWSGVSEGHCILTWHWTVQVSKGVMTGDKTSGHVSGAGAVSGHMTVFGSTYDFVGRMVGGHGSGSWRQRNDATCSGSWTASKS
jgi:hypothetical protein